MIFSESRGFIFFAVPKTGTHAIREALRPHLSAPDWEQQLRYGQQLSPLPEIAAVNHGHVSYQQLSKAIGIDAAAGMFRFAFVRHPYDRFVSVCLFSQNRPQLSTKPYGVDEKCITPTAVL